MTHIKVSGLTDPADAQLAVELGANIVACVFYAKSPRYVDMSQAWQIRSVLPSTVRFAGIFVDTPLPIVRHVASHTRLDLVQLFGAEPRADVSSLGPGAFKSVTVRQAQEVGAAMRTFLGRWGKPESAPAMLIHLVDDLAEQWSLITEHAARAPLLLAAQGLSDATAARAVTESRPWGIDVWETVEREPGRLDPERLARLVAAVRQADAALSGAAGGEP